MQRDVGERLLTYLDRQPGLPEVLLDLGCGTGYFQAPLQARFPRANYLGVDIAPGMVSYAREKAGGEGGWLLGDAEDLPLASGSIDLVFSSLALQWCYRLDHLFAELARVLKPGGKCVFTTLGPHTLKELRESWAAADGFQHVNTFLPLEALQEAAGRVPGVVLELEQQTVQLHYDRVRDLLGELKVIGAHNMNPSRPVGLASRGALTGMLKAYEQWRTGEGLPATWDVIFGVLEVK